jgi:hypothetical protein
MYSRNDAGGRKAGVHLRAVWPATTLRCDKEVSPVLVPPWPSCCEDVLWQEFAVESDLDAVAGRVLDLCEADEVQKTVSRSVGRLTTVDVEKRATDSRPRPGSRWRS